MIFLTIVIARSRATKQSSYADADWIAAPFGLAMTGRVGRYA